MRRPLVEKVQTAGQGAAQGELALNQQLLQILPGFLGNEGAGELS